MTWKEAMEKQQSVRIPVWLITLIIPLMGTLGGFLVYQAKQQQNIFNTLQHQAEAIKEIKIDLNEKASKSEMIEVRTYMMRIEDKLDRLIEKSFQ